MSLRARALWIAGVLLMMAWLAYPSFFSEQERLESGFIPDFGMNLGLDLQGGIHWLLKIDTATAVKQEMENNERWLRERFAEEGIDAEVALIEDREIVIHPGSTPPEAVEENIATFSESLEVSRDDGDLRLGLSERWYRGVVERGVLQAQEVLRRRIDKLGVTEPVIAPQGAGRILVQMPGEIDPERARGVLEDTTFLEFKRVLDSDANESLLAARYPDGLPDETQIVSSKNDLGEVSEAFLVPQRAELTGAMLEDARLGFDRRNRPLVEFTWNSEGTRLFREFTGENIGQRLAAIIDGDVVTAPVIQARIGRRGVIEGRFDQQEAADLAVKLRSGALPIPLQIEEERSVGPTLGADSIRQGLRSVLLGGLAVILFMIIYYRVSGAAANAALLLNLVIIIGLMGLAGATLTLPGIAGIVLTVGMAVDANVIIFERIREELRTGKSVRNAVQIGFQRSRLTILDANITTMIAAVVLLYFGRGPVQGFGVTLAVGIVSSVFCALVVTRLFLDLLLARGVQALRV
jgi:preprotein translocase subunit SecD